MTTYLQQSVAPTVNSTTGLWTYSWPPISRGQTASVSVAVPQAPSSVTWTVFVASQAVGAMPGGAAAGPYNVPGGSAVTVTGTPPATPATYTAVMIGAQGDPGDFPPSTPAAAGTAPPTPFVWMGNFLASASWAAIVSPLATGVLVLATNAPTGAIASSAVSGQVIPLPVFTISGPVAGDLGVYYIPVPSGSFPTGSTVEVAGAVQVIVNFAALTTGLLYEIDTPTFPFAAAAAISPVYTVTVANPAPGADWTYTLPAPARLKAVASALTPSGAANRYPFLAIATAGSAATIAQSANATAITAGASGGAYCDWWPGVADTSLVSGTYQFQKTGMPDLMLPAGSVIKSITVGLQAADQWSSIALTFSPV